MFNYGNLTCVDGVEFGQIHNFEQKLAKLAARAEKVAASCPKQDKKAIREFLREDGIAGEIDEV